MNAHLERKLREIADGHYRCSDLTALMWPMTLAKAVLEMDEYMPEDVMMWIEKDLALALGITDDGEGV